MRTKREKIKATLLRRILTCLVSVVMIVAFTPVAAWGATGTVEYLDWNATSKTLEKNSYTGTYTEITASMPKNWSGGWYVVSGTVEINGRVTVNGNVHLILTDGCSLTVNGGINVITGNSLTIYGQSGGTGSLTATANSGGYAGIGGNAGQSGGTITINGGMVKATGSGNLNGGGAGIGGGRYQSGGTITVNGGSVVAGGGDGTTSDQDAGGGAGIGSGGGDSNYYASGGIITISGGSVTAFGGGTTSGGGAGIGGGGNAPGGTITISGGSVTAFGGGDSTRGGAGIGGGGRKFGGTITISGGVVKATGGNGTLQNGFGIGAGGAAGSSMISFITTDSGNAVVFANSISNENNQGDWHGVVFKGVSIVKDSNNAITVNNGTGQVYGLSVAPSESFTVPSGATLTVPKDTTLDLSGITAMNNGSVYVDGTLSGTFDESSSGAVYYPLSVTGGRATGSTEGDISEYNTKTYGKEGGKIALSATTLAGADFSGWSISPNVNITDNSFGMPNNPVIVAAQFEYKPKYEVIYNTDGGSNIDNKTEVKWTDKVLADITDPAKTGYIFAGWKYGDGTVAKDATYGGVASDDQVKSIKLTAQWTECKHEGELTHTPAAPSTYTEYGVKEYWQCNTCNVYLSDNVNKTVISDLDSWKAGEGKLDKLPPEIIEGKGQSITAGEKKGLTFKSNAAYNDFIRVELDGKTLDAKNYTVKEGNTVVTLNADYVATLPAAEYTIGIVSTSGTATTTFTVNAKVNAWDETVLRLQSTASKTSIKLKWNAVPEADGYVIYWSKCGSKKSFKQVKVIESEKTLTWTHKKLKKGSWNRYYVKAYKVIDGKKSFIKTSNKIHLTTKGGKYTNVKKLKASISGVTLKKGKTKVLKIKQTYAEKNKKPTLHMRPLTYTTSDKTVATVTKKGVIKAKGTGSCYIYITAYSGVYTRVKVTVK